MNIQTQPPVVSGRPQPGSPKSAFIADVVRKCMAATRRDVAMVIRCWRDSQNARKGDVLRQEFATAAEELLKMSGRRGLPCLSLDEAHRYVERCKASLGQKGVQA